MRRSRAPPTTTTTTTTTTPTSTTAHGSGLGLALAALAVLAALHPAQAQDADVCSISSGAPAATGTVKGDVLFSYPSFNGVSGNLTLTWTEVAGNDLQLTQEATNGGTVGYAWYGLQQRIADGFVSNFTFVVQPNTDNGGNAGDGFTYFVQNDKIVDLNGGTGAYLGSYGIGPSVAVGVDLCPTRPSCGATSQIKLVVTNSAYQQNTWAFTNIPKSLADGNTHSLVVAYTGSALGANASVIVSLDGTEFFNGPQQIGDLTALLGSRFAWFGFTASTSWSQTATIGIESWNVLIQPSNVVVKEYETALAASSTGVAAPLQIVYGTEATFTIQARDSCGNILTTPLAGVSAANVSATLTEQVAPGTVVLPNTLVVLTPNITENSDGSFTLVFPLPLGFIGNFNLDANVSDVAAEGMPWTGAVAAYRPAPELGGLPVWALVLLILLALLLIIVISYVVYRLNRYRRKLRENADFIEAGKKQAALDRLEDGTTYVQNPMVGTLDDLKAQLAKNQAELDALRKRGALGEDQNYTIDQLQKQRDDLLSEMNRLKREAQVAGVEETTKADFNQVQQASARKKQFGAQLT